SSSHWHTLLLPFCLPHQITVTNSPVTITVTEPNRSNSKLQQRRIRSPESSHQGFSHRKSQSGKWRMGRGVNRRGGMLPRVENGNVYEFATTGLGVGYGFEQSVDTLPRPVHGTVPLPPNVASTLYVLGLPPDSTRREVARIPPIILDFSW
ncbi:RNA-binding protein 2-like protein, partial [Drosera capensis]